MQVGLGVSVGSEVVCSAIVIEHGNGTRTSEYRTVSKDDQANNDVGELVGSSIELITSLIPAKLPSSGRRARTRREADGFAVACRTEHEAAVVRSAAGNRPRRVKMVPESAAALAFLNDAGIVSSFSFVAIVDLGASGTTVTVVDPQSGTVFVSERSARATDSDLDSLIQSVAATLTQSHQLPDAIVTLGGGARTAVFAAVLRRKFDMPVLELDEPDAVLAIGAALLALSASASSFPVVALESSRSMANTVGGLSSVLIGAAVVGGLVLAYGVQSLVPGDSKGFSPAGTVSSTSQSPPPTQDPTVNGSALRTGAQPSNDTRAKPNSKSAESPTAPATPYLRPGPDLPVLQWPMPATDDTNPGGAQPSFIPPRTVAVTPDPSTSPSESVPPSTTGPVTTEPSTTEPSTEPTTTEPAPVSTAPTANPGHTSIATTPPAATTAPLAVSHSATTAPLAVSQSATTTPDTVSPDTVSPDTVPPETPSTAAPLTPTS